MYIILYCRRWYHCSPVGCINLWQVCIWPMMLYCNVLELLWYNVYIKLSGSSWSDYRKVNVLLFYGTDDKVTTQILWPLLSNANSNPIIPQPNLQSGVIWDAKLRPCVLRRENYIPLVEQGHRTLLRNYQYANAKIWPLSSFLMKESSCCLNLPLLILIGLPSIILGGLNDTKKKYFLLPVLSALRRQ